MSMQTSIGQTVSVYGENVVLSPKAGKKDEKQSPAPTSKETVSKKGLVLWGNNTCPYVQRVRISLAERKLKYVFKLVDVVGTKSSKFVALYAKAIPHHRKRPCVPLLENRDDLSSSTSDVAIIPESSIILEYLENYFRSDKDVPSLRPEGALLSARCSLYVQLFLQEMKPLTYEILNAATMSALTDIVDKGKRACNMLEEQLKCIEHARSGSDSDGEVKAEGEIKNRPKQDCFVLGDSFSLAEATLAPHLQRLVFIAPKLRREIITTTRKPNANGLDLFKHVFGADKCPRFCRWASAVLSRPSVVATFNEEEVTELMKRGVVVWKDAGGMKGFKTRMEQAKAGLLVHLSARSRK
eukprot:jgi/Bigna1/88838/estExt_fgenesh1_pg.C_390034